ncbi:hypothetical protein [Bacillus thuringiensis]|uniref:hypothetical protein n=1 Tax=Bacillus thuringiensis TaxID=1428 RepID=UPI0018DFEE9A|nr:hypothetical protein [Bacillus thuringiensis]
MKLLYVKRMLIGCIVFFLGSGCLPKTIIDDVNLVQAVIFEAYKKQIRMTFIAPQRTKGNKVQIFQSTAHSMKRSKTTCKYTSGTSTGEWPTTRCIIFSIISGARIVCVY